MIELLVLIGLMIFGVFVVGAVMLHILVGLILLPLKLIFVVFKGVLFAVFALPLALVGASLGLAILSILLAVGVVAMVCCAVL